MFVQEVSIEIKNPKIKRQELIEKMEWLIGTTSNNGQTQDTSDQVYFRGNCLVWLTCTLEKTSFSPKNDSPYVSQLRREIEILCQDKFQVKILGKEACQTKRLCRCKKPSSYVLWTNYINELSPLDCGDCGGNVPLYRIPKPPESYRQDHYSIARWDIAYQACDRLQMQCGFGERWGMKQMQDYDSGLSKEGREACREIEIAAGVPVYYYLFNYRNITEERDKQRPCPECGGNWLLSEPWLQWFDFRCDQCRLVSSITCNAR